MSYGDQVNKWKKVAPFILIGSVVVIMIAVLLFLKRWEFMIIPKCYNSQSKMSQVFSSLFAIK